MLEPGYRVSCSSDGSAKGSETLAIRRDMLVREAEREEMGV
jgi:hypothetical protein